MSEGPALHHLFERGDDLSARGVQAFQAGSNEEGSDLFRRAITAYEKPLAEAPQHDELVLANLRLCIGARRFGLGEVDPALEVFSAVAAEMTGRADLADNPQAVGLLAQARLNRADCRLAKGEPEQALAEVEEVLTEFPDHPYGVYLRDRCRGG
jgi:tetratricopeptide (TPR) repeat protein